MVSSRGFAHGSPLLLMRKSARINVIWTVSLHVTCWKIQLKHIRGLHRCTLPTFFCGGWIKTLSLPLLPRRRFAEQLLLPPCCSSALPYMQSDCMDALIQLLPVIKEPFPEIINGGRSDSCSLDSGHSWLWVIFSLMTGCSAETEASTLPWPINREVCQSEEFLRFGPTSGKHLEREEPEGHELEPREEPMWPSRPKSLTRVLLIVLLLDAVVFFPPPTELKLNWTIQQSSSETANHPFCTIASAKCERCKKKKNLQKIKYWFQFRGSTACYHQRALRSVVFSFLLSLSWDLSPLLNRGERER